MEVGPPAVSYIITVTDHFRYQDPDGERGPEPAATADEALRLARGIVDRSLDRLWKPGMGAAELLAAYNTFGEADHRRARRRARGRVPRLGLRRGTRPAAHGVAGLGEAAAGAARGASMNYHGRRRRSAGR